MALEKLAQEAIHKSEVLLDSTPRDDRYTWLQHPCTKALVLKITGDLYGVHLLWLGGAYSNEDSVDATSQLQAKARGMAGCFTDILETIELIGSREDDAD